MPTTADTSAPMDPTGSVNRAEDTSSTSAKVWTVKVSWAYRRPPTPRNQTASLVRVLARTPTEAALVAAQIVACRRECEMPTATEVLDTYPGG